MQNVRRYPVKPEVVKRGNSRTWYIKGVNINYSFNTLERIALELGADVEKGDFLIADNKNGDKRKAFKKTPNGCIILYASVLKGREFAELGNKGRLGDMLPLIDWFAL